MAKVISVLAYAGGVGKTTLTMLIVYILSEIKKAKVLVIDIDGQEDLSDFIKDTFNVSDNEENKDILDAIDALSFKESNSIQNITENLDLVQGTLDLEQFDTYVRDNFDEKGKYYLLYTLIKEIRNDYDYIIIDTSPRTTSSTDNAVCASDYAIIPTETTKKGRKAAVNSYKYLKRLLAHNEDIDLIGIVPYLKKNKDSSGDEQLEKLRELFEEVVFDNVVKDSSRARNWLNNGITKNKPYDKVTLKNYIHVIDEMIRRIEDLEGE
ncbi:ParA family protein [Staphylococcus aureus]|uniref:ParA family protein n=1 Tax=Staphylococcus TaxID=1279 RepID=UPI00111DD6E2|nr:MULTISPECIES: ParA family protein [Staphylococcus]MBW5882095.1 ParA family protein [Staphylococcus aureus]TOZ68279.1 ParA family protein [Staphylococcus pseudintermedius]